MMISLLLVDVQGFDALAKGQANPAALLRDLSENLHGVDRQIAVMRAYCSTRVSSYRRTAFREAGFEIIDTAGPDETLIRISIDLFALSTSDVTYEEAILLGGAIDYTALARLARERLMMVSVLDHGALPAALEALADGLIDMDDLEIDRTTAAPSATPTSLATPTLRQPNSTPAPMQMPARMAPAITPPPTVAKPEPVAPKADSKPTAAPDGTDDGDVWPDPKAGPILIAGSSGTAAMADAVRPLDPMNGEAGPESPTAEPLSEPTAEQATALDDALAASLTEDLEAELMADVHAVASQSPRSSQPASAEAARPDMDPALDDDSIDALFADLGSLEGNKPSADKSGEQNPSQTHVAHAVTPDPDKQDHAKSAPGDSDTDADVDALLSRLMSDDLAVDPKDNRAASKLDLVPER